MKVDAEFESLIPPLTAEEYSGLEASIIAEGCRDALVCWNDILIDGHNRYKICIKHNISFNVIQRDFVNRNEVLLWIMRNQLSRRNLTDFQRVEIVRKCEEAIKAQARERQATSTGGSKPQLKEKLPEAEKKQSRDELGKMAGVSGKTYEHAAEVIDEAPEPVIEATRKNELSINSAYEVVKMPFEEQQEISTRIENGENPKSVVKEVLKRPHVSYNSGNSEWYTPAEYIELAHEVMGNIDLDPASSEIANKIVQAKKYYTAENDGLSQEWSGNIWLNPPYASELINKFVDKFITELTKINQAIILVNNATETEWFNKLVRHSSALCFPSGRVKFYRPDGTIGAPLQGQALIYFGEQAKKFIEIFKVKGWCVLLNEI